MFYRLFAEFYQDLRVNFNYGSGGFLNDGLQD